MTLVDFLAGQLDQGTWRIGQIVITRDFTITHQDDQSREDLKTFDDPNEALEIARFDDAGKYRPLKTAANLRHGWKLMLKDASEIRLALDYFYPAALGTLQEWQSHHLRTTSVRETLARQTGMYAVVKKISDDQIHQIKTTLCGGTPRCLRHILWTVEPSQPMANQSEPATSNPPLLCAEICNLFVAEGRKAVKKA